MFYLKMSKINKFIINKKTKITEIKDNLNHINFQFLNDLTKYSFARIYLDNTFIVFNSINNILFLIYSTKNKSIISYNLINKKIINEIKNAHEYDITNLRYYLDNNNKRDLILSISYFDNNIKLWNINSYECLINIKKINKYGYLYSACFLNNNNQIYIISSNGDWINTIDFELIKVYDLKGNIIKKINNSKDNAWSIYNYGHNNPAQNYIVTVNYDNIKSYDYEENKIYHKYFDNNKYLHLNLIMNKKEDVLIMF